MTESERSTKIVGLIPGGGWMIFHSDIAHPFSDPVIAWALQADGDVIPLEADAEGRGYAYPVGLRGDGREREFWHPDSSDQQSQLRLRHYRQQIERGGD